MHARALQIAIPGGCVGQNELNRQPHIQTGKISYFAM